ncbi:hypothetical protein PG999_012206 [Apiospora kogelbergensis]|uniref:Uncharacterized protein n=1 Tax=Apiospora kogelbergensis TaxID=1337665 RepID=A0AAW0QME9_9PEZI
MASANLHDDATVVDDREKEKASTNKKRPPKPKRGRDKLPRKRERTGQLTLEFKKRPAKAPPTPPQSEPDDTENRCTSLVTVDAARDEDLLASVPRGLDELPLHSDSLRTPGTRRLFHMVVTHRWIPSLSGKTVNPMYEAAGQWHMQRTYQDDAMLEADLCRALRTRSDHTRSPADYTAFLAVLTRCIGRLRREISAVGEGRAGPMLSDAALVTTFALSTADYLETQSVGLFGDALYPRHDYMDGQLRSYFRSDHWPHIYALALDIARRAKGKGKGGDPGGNSVLSQCSIIFYHVMTMYASYNLIPHAFDLYGPYLMFAQDLDAWQALSALPTDDTLLPPDDEDVQGPRLRHLYRCMRIVCHIVPQVTHVDEGATEGAATFVSVACYLEVIQHRLLALPRADPAIEIYRLGALVYAFGVIAFVKADDTLLLLVENLTVALQASRYTEGQPPELLFWAAMLGAMATAPHPGSVVDGSDQVVVDCWRRMRYLVRELKRLARVLGLGSWEKAEAVLQCFIWTNSSCDAGAKCIWDVCQAESEAEQMKILQVVRRAKPVEG